MEFTETEFQDVRVGGIVFDGERQWTVSSIPDMPTGFWADSADGRYQWFAGNVWDWTIPYNDNETE